MTDQRNNIFDFSVDCAFFCSAAYSGQHFSYNGGQKGLQSINVSAEIAAGLLASSGTPDGSHPFVTQGHFDGVTKDTRGSGVIHEDMLQFASATHQLGAPKPGCVYVCDFCDESFSRKFNLTMHLRRKHEVGSSLNCSVCGAKFRSKIRLYRHSLVCPAKPQ